MKECYSHCKGQNSASIPYKCWIRQILSFFLHLFKQEDYCFTFCCRNPAVTSAANVPVATFKNFACDTLSRSYLPSLPTFPKFFFTQALQGSNGSACSAMGVAFSRLQCWRVERFIPPSLKLRIPGFSAPSFFDSLHDFREVKSMCCDY